MAVKSFSISGKTSFFGPQKLLLKPLLEKGACFCFLNPQMLPSVTPNCGPVVEFPVVLAHKKSFLLNAAEYCLRGTDIVIGFR